MPDSHEVHWDIGSLRVHRVEEFELSPAAGQWLFPDLTPAQVEGHDWLRPDLADPEGRLRLSCHSFALRTRDGRAVVIDTGVGNDKPRANPIWDRLDTDYLGNLRAAGFDPESVDLVITTHLHTDHVGWNTRLLDGAWVPTFPNARYLVSRREREFWGGIELDAVRRQLFADSVEPVEDAGLYDLVDVGSDPVEVAPGISLVPTPGHTPGHVSVLLEDGGASALVTGDCLHHPLQVEDEGLTTHADIDSAQAVRTRADLLDRLAADGTIVLGTHFPSPSAGTVTGPSGQHGRTPFPPT